MPLSPPKQAQTKLRAGQLDIPIEIATPGATRADFDVVWHKLLAWGNPSLSPSSNQFPVSAWHEMMKGGTLRTGIGGQQKNKIILTFSTNTESSISQLEYREGLRLVLHKNLADFLAANIEREDQLIIRVDLDPDFSPTDRLTPTQDAILRELQQKLPGVLASHNLMKLAIGGRE